MRAPNQRRHETCPTYSCSLITFIFRLCEYTDKLREAGATDCVVLAGAVTNPLGPYPDSMSLLEADVLERKGFRSIGVAGHPEGSPDIPNNVIDRALMWKQEYAKSSAAEFYIVTQFVFEADPIIKWDQELQNKGVNLPVHIGVPGLATLKTLINHARACGIGPSMRFLTRQASNVTKLMTTNAPDTLLMDLSDHVKHQTTLIRGVHFYPLGGMRKTAEWVEAVRQGKIEEHGRTFKVT